MIFFFICVCVLKSSKREKKQKITSCKWLCVSHLLVEVKERDVDCLSGLRGLKGGKM